MLSFHLLTCHVAPILKAIRQVGRKKKKTQLIAIHNTYSHTKCQLSVTRDLEIVYIISELVGLGIRTIYEMGQKLSYSLEEPLA